VYVAVRTKHVPAGTPIVVRLMQGDRNIESVDVVSGTPDAEAEARMLARLPAGATLSVGAYQVEVLLDGVSQGIRPLSVAGAQ
jgi:hypothetical protein